MPTPASPDPNGSTLPPPPRAGLGPVTLWLLLIGALAALPIFWPADGVERSSDALFVGRLHPLVVHFPIALLFLVPVLEIAGVFASGRHLRRAAGFVLGLGAASAVVAAALGWLLAFTGGYAGERVNAHLWSGCTLALAALLTFLLQRQFTRRGWLSLGLFYYPSLVATLGFLVWTAHQGGQLTHGERYLEEHMPARLREWLGVPAPAKAQRPPSAALPALPTGAGGAAVVPPERSFFAERIMPAMDRTCVSCHNPDKTKGGLLLDTYGAMLTGGDSGPSIVPGKPAESELYRRITLPHDDEEFMPSGGKKPLSAEETRWIEQWIAAGAPERGTPSSLAALLPAAPDAAGTAVEAPAVAPPKPTAPQAAAPDFRPQEAIIAQLETRLGVRLVPVSLRPTDGLILRTASAPARCDDQVIEALAPVAAFIVDAELARTAVGDTGVAVLARWPNLRRLDLTQTAVTAGGVAALRRAPALEVLNLTETSLTPAEVETLRERAGLRLFAAHLEPPPAPAP